MVKYTNYKGNRYYLYEGVTRKGNSKYWFSKSIEGKMVDDIPEGFEIYEEPNGMVYLRKIQSKLITNEEIEIIKDSIPCYCQ